MTMTKSFRARLRAVLKSASGPVARSSIAVAKLPTAYGDFQIHAYEDQRKPSDARRIGPWGNQ